MKNILYVLGLLAVLAGCTSDSEPPEEDESISGGCLKYNETQFLRTTFPQITKDVVSSHIITQVYEGLVKYDSKNMSVVPAIAKSWEKDSSGTVYTFHLHPDVYFHDNACFENGKGRKVTAADFKFTFHVLSTQTGEQKNFFGSIDKIKGAKNYYIASANEKPDFEIEGIKVIDDTTLELTIEKPSEIFLINLANFSASVIPKEGYEKYGNNCYVGSGPFYMEGIPEKDQAVTLFKNKQYYKHDNEGNRLPYLDSVKITFIKSATREIELFEKCELDIVMGLKTDLVTGFLEKHIDEFQSKPPKYILEASGVMDNLQNLRKSNVQNFFTNSQNYLDLSIVYFQDPVVEETAKGEGEEL